MEYLLHLSLSYPQVLMNYRLDTKIQNCEIICYLISIIH